MAEHALLLANHAAGSAAPEQLDAVTDILHEAYVLRRAFPENLTELRAALDGFAGERVIVAGGDGSLHVLINALADAGRLADVAVGIVPLGTGNDFAGGIGLPDDPVVAARACLEARPQPVDAVLADDGEYVVNAAHAGIGAVAAERALDFVQARFGLEHLHEVSRLDPAFTPEVQQAMSAEVREHVAATLLALRASSDVG